MSLISYVSDYLKENNLDENFEQYTNEDLATQLRAFYASLRKKSGQEYSKSGYISIRAAINRHLTSPPFSKSINIIHDKEFMLCNQVFTGIIRKMRESGKDVTHHKTAIPEGDMAKMYETKTLSNDTPLSLLRKVFVEISINFGRRGREGLRELTRESIIIKKDDKGQEYATMTFNELDKNHQNPSPKEPEKKQILYSQDDSDLCPILSLKKYISKLNPKCSSFFQRPRNLKNPALDPVWYENKSLGIHTLENMMKNISADANLSQTYTNHCLRATTTTILGHAGVDGRNICSVTGHKNLQSLDSYIKEPTMDQRKNMCTILHNYGKKSNPKTSLALPNTSTNKKPSCTITKPITTVTEENTTATITKPPEESLFSGAQFLGQTTINVMINKTQN